VANAGVRGRGLTNAPLTPFVLALADCRNEETQMVEALFVFVPYGDCARLGRHAAPNPERALRQYRKCGQ
jgi:hypothetical protein